MKGKFITFEGSEGSGKSTQVALVYRYLKDKGMDVKSLREPGGVKISESVRRILLNVENEQMTHECETLLYMAARAQLVAEVIEPVLKKGTSILCDRFLDSTVVYQGCGNGVSIDFIKQVGQFVTRGITPDLTLLFDLPAEKGLSRIGQTKDRIELRPLAYHKRVRQGYLDLASQEPERIKVVKVEHSKEDIFEVVRTYIDSLLGLS